MPKSYTFRNLRMQNWECCGKNPKIPAKDILVSTYVGNKLRNMIKSYATKVAKSYNDIDDGGLSEDESDGTSWIYENTKPSTFKALPKQADEDFEKGNTHGSPYLNFHAYVAKYKGELPKAKAQFYYCLVNLGVFCDNATTWNSFQFPVLEVITPYDKGFEYFAKTIKANLFKINLKTVTKTKIVNEFPRKKKTTATASAERKFRFKDGSVITASTVEEAKEKHKVIASRGSVEEILKKLNFKKIDKNNYSLDTGLYYNYSSIASSESRKLFIDVHINEEDCFFYLTIKGRKENYDLLVKGLSVDNISEKDIKEFINLAKTINDRFNDWCE